MKKDFSLFKKVTDSSLSLLTNGQLLVSVVEDELGDKYNFYYDHSDKKLYVELRGNFTTIDLSKHIRKNGKISSLIEVVKEFEEILIDDLKECMGKF